MLLSILSVLALANKVIGWGDKGHSAVGYIAMEFLNPTATEFVKSTLGPDYNGSLGVAATWADSVRRTPEYKWSAGYHFVDAEDDPPTSCSVLPDRDCPNNDCILTAVANYTVRLADDLLPGQDRQEALEFLGSSDPFLGDIGQPLHAEGKGLGGNRIMVQCNGQQKNLHSVWDDSFVDQLVRTQYQNSTMVWIKELVRRIKSGEYQGAAGTWAICTPDTILDPSRRSLGQLMDTNNLAQEQSVLALGDSDSEGEGVLECPLVWARESNEIVCSYLWTYSSYDDVCNSTYYEGAVTRLELQIAKQGYRLAEWLNGIVG